MTEHTHRFAPGMNCDASLTRPINTCKNRDVRLTPRILPVTEFDSLIKAACDRIDSDQRFTKGAYNSLVKKVNALYLKFQKKDTTKTSTTKTAKSATSTTKK